MYSAVPVYILHYDVPSSFCNCGPEKLKDAWRGVGLLFEDVTIFPGEGRNLGVAEMDRIKRCKWSKLMVRRECNRIDDVQMGPSNLNQ